MELIVEAHNIELQLNITSILVGMEPRLIRPPVSLYINTVFYFGQFLF